MSSLGEIKNGIEHCLSNKKQNESHEGSKQIEVINAVIFMVEVFGSTFAPPYASLFVLGSHLVENNEGSNWQFPNPVGQYNLQSHLLGMALYLTVKANIVK
jgi:hypothetical protein